ncbi:component of the polarisome [Podila minutissima]|nr:component of the polarisome [Podila minutissima]
MNHPESLRKQQTPQWQPSPYGGQQQQQQQGYPTRPLHPSVSSTPSSLSANRSTSPQPTSPVSPSHGNMHINTKPGTGSQQQRSNPSSPVGAQGNVMEIAARHYESLQRYLLAHILKEKHGVSEQRIAAREKLSRLLQNQLQDLSTDVYDELNRRTDGAQVPFLAVRDDYHPKRNQARQKLATLPQNRFKDLASDVYVQLERQFPTLMEMFPLKALEEKQFSQPSSYQQQQDRDSDREPTTPVVQQSSVVPNISTFTIQDNSNAEEETYYRSPGQQGPASPALDGNVNFSSLDSLMADIGNIVSKDGSDPKASKPLEKSTQDTSDMAAPKEELRSPLKGTEANTVTNEQKEEYESRISALCKRLQHLESEVGEGVNRPEGSRLTQVERQLAKQTEMYNEQSTRLTKLQLDYNKVLNDYHAQLETVDMVNQEVKSLVMETKNLKQRHVDAEEELQLAYNRIKQLEDENGDLKADLEDAQREQKRLQEEASTRLAPKEIPSVSVPHAPISSQPNNSVNNVGNSNANINININSSVNGDLGLGSNNLNNSYQSNNHDMSDEDDMKNDDDWNQGRQQVRDSALVNPNSVIHQESLNSFRNAVDDLLSAGRSDSSSSVLVGMKAVVIACKAVTEDVEDFEHEAGPGEDVDAFAELKQEMSSGLTQLMTAAKVHSSAFNEDEEEFERTLRDLENSADQLEAIVMDIVNVPKASNSSFRPINDNNSNNMGNDSRPHLDDHSDDELHKPSLNHNNQTNGSNGRGDNDEPMDALDLKIYLETQTESIVSSIQNLLTSLRSSSDHEDILDASDHITKIVDQVIRMTRLTLGSPQASSVPQATELRNQGEMVLEDLENSLDLLIEMKEQLEAEPELAHSSSADAKSVKQKLASASFDIAKYTKELVSLIED